MLQFLRTNEPLMVHWSNVGSLFERFNHFLTFYKIKEKHEDKGYDLNVQQALCIAQTDPEPEAKEQAHQALDA